MVLLSAKEDFLQRTLSAVPGLMARLVYVSRLRGERGYDHWGLARIYGDEAAHKAVAEVHSDLWTQLLRTPIRKLVAECEGDQGNEFAAILEEWEKNPQPAVPSNLRGGSLRHFNTVVSALSCLSHGHSRIGHSRSEDSPPAATQ